MTDQEIKDRFEELDAGRILGDLDADEVREWEELSKDPRCQSDPSLELVAAALTNEFHSEAEEELPASVLKKLELGKADFIVPDTGDSESESVEDQVIRPSLWKKILAAPETGWAIAALVLLFLVAQVLLKDSPPEVPQEVVSTPEQMREALVGKAGDLVQSEFGGTEAYDGMSGEVVWSDELQEGYMTLTNLPANDPKSKQYQLWIVDPTRDEKPVDGGVFDIPAGAVTAVVPIKNPLTITNPQAFVITLEQPGGVVVSKQEVVVALAKTS